MICLASGWGRYPVIETEWREVSTRAEAAAAMHSGGGIIARGNGRAYGDAAIGASITLSTVGLDRMISFDPATGALVLEAGVLLADVIATFLPRGFFPIVVPGTRYVTIGGAIAADVHGKNHHKDGSFGDHVIDVTVATGGEIVRASRTDNSDLFWSTIGGMGLTGTILTATIRLRQVETSWIRQQIVVTSDLTEAIAALDAADDASYSVAWIDCVARGAALGRSLVFRGEHVGRAELRGGAGQTFPAMGEPRLTLPFELPDIALNHLGVVAFNEAYFRLGARKAGEPFLVAAGSYFFPLDNVANWNRIYGRRGFVQHQCVLPPASAAGALAEMLNLIARRGGASFLTVLKKLGRSSSGVLSFPFEGYTLALDFPMTRGLLAFLDELDLIVVNSGGRLYLAKDARQSRETFDAGYPTADRFRAYRRGLDPDHRIRSHLSERLAL
jgi:decaprenylphospho-beta-D-ribofuranose 2-oxidase